MAVSDDTSRARLSVPSEPKSTPRSKGPRYLTDLAEGERPSYLATLAGTALAAHTLQHVLENSEAAHGAQAEGLAVPTGHWPLTTAQTNSLYAALHHLRYYVESIRSEQGG